MGKGSRWFRSLFRLKKYSYKDNINVDTSHLSSDPKGYCNFSEQNTHIAIVVAAEAAVAAAQAAVEVVRLTSRGGRRISTGGTEKWAALKIQSVFRGYLVINYLPTFLSIFFFYLY